MDFLKFLFWPNPGNATYTSPKALGLLLLCLAMVSASMIITRWRRGLKNPITRKLSGSWSLASLWFGLVGLFMVVVRVEGISYVSMRFWWLIWGMGLLLYVAIQIRLFRARHYDVLPREDVEDLREKYLPKRKKKRS